MHRRRRRTILRPPFELCSRRRSVERELLQAAHEHCTGHRSEVAASDQCGCFHCLEVFPPQRILEWIDEGDSALCPYCGTDAVIGSAAGFPIARTFLREMRRHWFRWRPGPSIIESFLHAVLGPRHRKRWLEYQALLQRAVVDTDFHRESILASEACGCYWCMAIFPPAAIKEWTDVGVCGVGQTAVCAYCGEGGVLGSADGYPITRRFLRDVRRPFF